MDKNVPTNFEFPITISGVQQISQTLSKGRLRIFYKYENRNGSYITDEFAEKLLSTLPYAPVKGIYDVGSCDYLDHGAANTQGRIYGIVPADPHVAWERHLDEDGVEREYATCDVIIYTALYEEANKIIGKSQSMELYPPSIDGHWEVHDGQQYFTFTDACFFGLQVLGSNVEPCFEGAAFFSLNEYKGIIDLLNKYTHQNGGISNMADINEEISSEVVEKEFEQVVTEAPVQPQAEQSEPEFSAEAETEVETEVEEFKADEKKEDDKKDEKEDEKEEEAPQDAPAEDPEKKKEDDKKNSTLSTEEYEAQISSLKEENDNYCMKINELENQISTLNMESEAVKNEFAASKDKIAELEKKVEELSSYKYAVEKSQKESVINEYNDLLPNEVIEEFTANIDKYSALELDKELAYALKNANISVFTTTPTRIPSDEIMDGISEILSRYKK